MLNDVTAKPIRAWDSRSHQFRTAYDPLRRPTDSFLREGAGGELLVGRTVYGETQPNPEANNLHGQVVQLFDQAGVVTSDEYDFKGNLLRSQRQLAQEYKATLDWSVAAAVPLEAPTYTSRTRYDALNRPTELTAPDNSVIRPGYNEANLLERMEANLRGAAVATPFVTDIDCDAKGQRTRIEYGNGARTTYAHDPRTFRLIHLQTTRGAEQLQDLRYTFDPVGNITHIRDDAQQTLYFRNRRVEPSAEYTYDAIYRLIEATGREHLGQTGGQPNPPTAPDAFNGFHTRLDHPGDGNAMGTYVERYLYDAVGNILTMQHHGSDPVHPGWTRAYAYIETSQLEAGKLNNRLSSTTLGATTETYLYDGSAGLHGNITAMTHLPLMQWDDRDQLQTTAQQVVTNGGTPETAWYVYDAGGRRVRKVTERQAAAGQTPTRMKERIYLGGFEIYREYENDGATIELERETLHIMDDQQRIALVDTRTQGNDGSPAQLIRYQFGNHLGSASLELDDQAQIISYEEYTPYGSTSYQAVRSQTETPKRYRYTGKERDEESGLYYHGARYYAPWLGRWIGADPIGIADGSNLYSYVRNHPVSLSDPSGMQGQPQLHPIVTEDPSSNTYEVGEFGSGTYLRETEKYTEVWKEGGPQVVSFADDKITAHEQSPPPKPKPDPKPEPVQPFVAPLENVKHSEAWTPRAVVRENWEKSIDDAANSANPWYVRGLGFAGAVGNFLPTAGETIIHGIIAMPQLAVTETIAAGEHGARAYLLYEAGSNEAALDEMLASGQAGAEGVANTAGTVAMVGGAVGPKGTPPIGGGKPPTLGGGTPGAAPKPLTYGNGYNMGYERANAGLELVLGKYPGNVQYVGRTPGTVTLDVPTGWTPNYNAGYVRGFLDAGGNIRFTSQQFTGTFKLEAQQVLGIPGAPW